MFAGSNLTVLRKINRNVDACADSVYQALLSAHEREPGFEATSDHAYLQLHEHVLCAHTSGISIGIGSFVQVEVLIVVTLCARKILAPPPN